MGDQLKFLIMPQILFLPLTIAHVDQARENKAWVVKAIENDLIEDFTNLN